MTILVMEFTADFAEDKDAAAKIRDQKIRPAIRDGKEVILDFTGVTLATQSFIHALVSDVIRTTGESVLTLLKFKGCNKEVKGIVRTVVQYSLEILEDENGEG